MRVSVCGVVMTVRMPVPGAIGMHMLVLVEEDLEIAAEGVGNAAERPEARHVVAPLQPRNHRLGHAQPLRQVLLRLAGA